MITPSHPTAGRDAAKATLNALGWSVMQINRALIRALGDLVHAAILQVLIERTRTTTLTGDWVDMTYIQLSAEVATKISTIRAAEKRLTQPVEIDGAVLPPLLTTDKQEIVYRGRVKEIKLWRVNFETLAALLEARAGISLSGDAPVYDLSFLERAELIEMGKEFYARFGGVDIHPQPHLYNRIRDAFCAMLSAGATPADIAGSHAWLQANPPADGGQYRITGPWSILASVKAQVRARKGVADDDLHGLSSAQQQIVQVGLDSGAYIRSRKALEKALADYPDIDALDMLHATCWRKASGYQPGTVESLMKIAKIQADLRAKSDRPATRRPVLIWGDTQADQTTMIAASDDERGYYIRPQDGSDVRFVRDGEAEVRKRAPRL